jgi:acyl carrier protein
MRDQADTLARLRAAFRRRFLVELPDDDVDLLESGLLDSLQLVELLVEIESEFGRRIPIDAIELDDLRSLTRLARLVDAEAAERTLLAASVQHRA